MKRYNAIYYLLFVVLIMGAFAAMAQNDYGTTVMGLVAAAFSLIFLIQLVGEFTTPEPVDWLNRIELVSLWLMAGLISLRVFYLHFGYVELLFGIAGGVFILVYLVKLSVTFKTLRNKNVTLAFIVAFFYLSIILFALAMTVVPIMPEIVEPTGMIAFGLLIAFVAGHFLIPKIISEGEETSPFLTVRKIRDRSILLASLFLAFSLYSGLTKFGFLPKVYSDEFPQSYFQLVNQAETGLEKPVNGKYKHEEFKAGYDRFVERNIATEKN